MRRDLLLTALVFAVIGFLGGMLYTRQSQSELARSLTTLTGGQAPEEMNLPEGHPPMDISRRIVELRQEVEKNPNDAGAVLRLAQFLLEVDRCSDAIVWFERGVTLEPRNLDARIALANCLAETGQPDPALKQLDAVLALQPDEPHALYHQALLFLRLKQDRAAAERIFRRLRQVNPNFPGVADLERQLGPGVR